MKKTSIFLLVMGVLLSQLFIIEYTFHNGFSFHRIVFKLLPVAAYAGKSSDQLYLTSTILGYILFTVFGVYHSNKGRYPGVFKAVFMFSAICIVVSFFEFTSILEDINGTFKGKFFHIGWLLFLLGGWIYSRIYLSRNCK